MDFAVQTPIIFLMLEGLEQSDNKEHVCLGDGLALLATQYRLNRHVLKEGLDGRLMRSPVSRIGVQVDVCINRLWTPLAINS